MYTHTHMHVTTVKRKHESGRYEDWYIGRFTGRREKGGMF